MAHDTACSHCPGSHTGELPCLASATVKPRSWLLVEHNGPWADRVEKMGLPFVPAALRHGVRPQLIRHPGRRPRGPHPLRVQIAWSGEQPWSEVRTVDSLSELDKLDLAAVARGRRPHFGELTEEPAFLVCTHAKRNVCCARTGAPLARHLARRFGGMVWETSHVGGDRHAANLVCMPHAIYYGDLDDKTAEEAVSAYLQGELRLPRLRGRAGMPEPAQAAEHFVREHTGLLGVDDVRVTSVSGTGPYMTRITAGGKTWSGTVELVENAGSCGSECDENVWTYQMRDLALHSEAALV